MKDLRKKIEKVLTDWMVNDNGIVYNGLHSILAPKLLNLLKKEIRRTEREIVHKFAYMVDLDKNDNVKMTKNRWETLIKKLK